MGPGGGRPRWLLASWDQVSSFHVDFRENLSTCTKMSINKRVLCTKLTQ